MVPSVLAKTLTDHLGASLEVIPARADVIAVGVGDWHPDTIVGKVN